MTTVHKNKTPTPHPMNRHHCTWGAARVAVLLLLKPGLDQQSWGLKGPSQEGQKEPYEDKEMGEEGGNKIKAEADIQFRCRKWFKLKQTGGSKRQKAGKK